MIRLQKLLLEVYGSRQLGVDLQSWANQKQVNFKKLDSNKRAGSYGSTLSDTFYQIGDKFALVRYETVAGAPRMNQLMFFVLDAPNTSAKVLGGEKYVTDFSYVERVLDSVKDFKASRSLESWNKQKIQALLSDLSKGMRDGNKISDDEAFELAQSALADNPGLEDAIKKTYKVIDVVGWLANSI